MSDAFSQSDDDLFSYDPSQEKKKNTSFDSFSVNSKPNNELYDQIAKDIKNNDEDNFLEINELRVKFSQAVLGSYYFWVNPSTAVSYVNTVTTVLDQLTNGRFSDLYLYNNLEITILRRSQLVYLLDGTFNQDNHKNDESFKSFMKKLGVDVDQTYIPTYVGTLIRISNSILARERSMYLELAQKLNIVPNPAVLDINSDKDDTDNMAASLKSTVNSIQEDHLSNIFIANFSESFVNKLNNMNQSNIDYEIRSL